MFVIQKSRFFVQQWQSYAQDYKTRAGLNIAEQFIVSVEEALSFIQQNPYACASYYIGEGYDDLQKYEFRKWNLVGFPHLVLFRIDKHNIFIEAIYSHRMNIILHSVVDIKQ